MGNYVQDCIPADENTHTIGAVRFGLDGYLYAASGDGGKATGVEYYNVRSLDPDSLAGKILRIDPLTGEGHPDNPFFDGDANSNRSKVYSHGLRNPFRFEIDPVTGEPIIGDVGWNAWEEINYGSGNFGWPCYEGGDTSLVQQGSYAGFAECQALYTEGTAKAAIYGYAHSGGNTAIQVGDVYQGQVYPEQYHGDLFIVDFNSEVMSSVTLSETREVLSVEPFASNLGGPVQISSGPDTNLYILDIYQGKINRLRYTGAGNAAPTANAEAIEIDPYTYDFSSQGSFDPDAEPLDISWNFGDGTVSSEPNPTHTFSSAGPVEVTLTVTDPAGASDSTTLTLDVANQAPAATILSPIDGFTYRTGDTIAFSGMAVDEEDGELTDASLQWDVKIYHNDHVHLDFYRATGQSGSFLATDHDDNSHYELCLTAVDSLGSQDQDCVEVFPEEVNYTFESTPTGLTLNYLGTDYQTPFTVPVPVGSTRSVSAPPMLGEYEFDNWSNGQPASHTFVVGESDSSFVANYQSINSPRITIRAAGDTGDEVIALQIDDGGDVATYNLSTSFEDYTFVLPEGAGPNRVRVVFTNDLATGPDYDRGVTVDYVIVGGEIYEAEDPSVYSTGTWDGVICGPGFKQSERLDCGGYLEFATGPIRYELGEIGNGIAVQDDAVGTGYIMHTLQDVFSRFSENRPYPSNSRNLIAVRSVNGQWEYNNNSNWFPFAPVATDRLLASVDFASDTIAPMQGLTGGVDGIGRGYSNGDLRFFADRWGDTNNDGEFRIEGTYFEIDDGSGPLTYQLGEVSNGVAVQDNAVGLGYIMHTLQDVFSRFSENRPYPSNSRNLIAVRSVNGQWEYNNNSSWFPFAPVATDRLLATVDFNSDSIIPMQGQPGVIDGIAQGYSNGDLTFFADRWGSTSNDGEFKIEGTYFEINDAGPVTYQLGEVSDGVAVQDDAVGLGYIMHTLQDVFSRFSENRPYPSNSRNLIAVRSVNGQWEYNNNSNWFPFAPVATDRILASVDFTRDTIAPLQGLTEDVDGIEMGYSNGDLTFFADRWGSTSNDGEFKIEGTYFEINDGAGPVTYQLGEVSDGVAVQDDAVGLGYIMHTLQDVFSRFSENRPHPSNSRNLIAVRVVSGQWEYNNNNAWFAFTPAATDRLLAIVDFSNDTITSLQGLSSEINGISQGYSRGDLTFLANRWGDSNNEGEFRVEGSYFELPS